MKEIVVVGAGGHAKAVIDVLEKSGGHRIVGVLDSYKPAGTAFFGYEVLGGYEWLHRHHVYGGIVAIGDNWTRAKAVTDIRTICPTFKFVTAVHRNASVAKGVRIGEGTVLMAGAAANSDSQLGAHCILNTHASVDHDCIVGDFASLAPNAATGGNVRIGGYSAISLGASVIHSITIGEHSVIGAGATVLSDIESYSVAYGTPARAVRKRSAGERYL
ncbi:acetyltransferase [Paenibacillus humicola]|uniref:acetyltransferase n=1 Tax=Paenibacillus humicola TaxID=3110540 RepID=UPI00237AC74A|nr:acetyltransferase [Paenibacillus humicola]